MILLNCVRYGNILKKLSTEQLRVVKRGESDQWDVKARECRAVHLDEPESAVNGGSVGCGCAAAHAGSNVAVSTRRQCVYTAKTECGNGNAPSDAR